MRGPIVRVYGKSVLILFCRWIIHRVVCKHPGPGDERPNEFWLEAVTTFDDNKAQQEHNELHILLIDLSHACK